MTVSFVYSPALSPVGQAQRLRTLEAENARLRAALIEEVVTFEPSLGHPFSFWECRLCRARADGEADLVHEPGCVLAEGRS